MVTRVKDDQLCVVQKFIDRQFRGKQYTVRKSDLIKVPKHSNPTDQSSEEEFVICPELHTNGGSDTSTEVSQISSEEDEVPTDTTSEENATDTESSTGSSAEDPQLEVEVEPTGRPMRLKKLPKKLEDYVLEMDSESD